jgi:hypothetical protein
VGWSNRYAWVRREADRCQAGTRREVRYHPADPNTVYLKQSWPADTVIVATALGVIGLFFTPAGVKVLWTASRFREIRCPSCRLPAAANHRWCTRCGAPLLVPSGTDGPLVAS